MGVKLLAMYVLYVSRFAQTASFHCCSIGIDLFSICWRISVEPTPSVPKPRVPKWKKKRITIWYANNSIQLDYWALGIVRINGLLRAVSGRTKETADSEEPENTYERFQFQFNLHTHKFETDDAGCECDVMHRHPNKCVSHHNWLPKYSQATMVPEGKSRIEKKKKLCKHWEAGKMVCIATRRKTRNHFSSIRHRADSVYKANHTVRVESIYIYKYYRIKRKQCSNEPAVVLDALSV